MSGIPEKLRKFGEVRKALGGHPEGYQFLFDAADEIERLRGAVVNLQFHNRGLQAELNNRGEL